MKRKQLTILAASLAAAFAANQAYAGQINSSSVTMAREVIESNSQILRAPSKSYSFAGDIDARTNEQRLQVQLILPAGASTAWNTATAAGVVTITNGDGSALAAAATIAVFVGKTNRTNDTLYANITVPVNAGNLVSKPIITFNPGATIGADNVGIVSVRGDAGATNNTDGSGTCVTPTNGVDVTFKHYTTFVSTALMTGANTDSEDQRPGAVNTGRLVNFVDNIVPTIKTTTGTLSVNNAGLTSFTGTGNAFVNTSTVQLGTVQIKQVGSGIDLDYTNQYGGASTILATAAMTDGTIDAKSFDVKVSALNGFAPNSSIFLSSAANCGAMVGSAAAVPAAGATSVTLSLTTKASIDAVIGAAHYICYQVTGADIIPQTTTSTLGTLLKAAPSSNDPNVTSTTNGVQEQRNICSGVTNPVGGGVKIDVRNYAQSTIGGGWMSIIRIINPNETTTAKVYGQLIHADGSYGGWGVLVPALAPRAVVNMTSAQIEALLTSAPVSNGTGYVAGQVAPKSGGDGSRLRITADNVGTLRVQNYIYNPDNKTFIEASGAQGVDFDAPSDRSPDQSQTVWQDAQRGLAK